MHLCHSQSTALVCVAARSDIVGQECFVVNVQRNRHLKNDQRCLLLAYYTGTLLALLHCIFHHTDALIQLTLRA